MIGSTIFQGSVERPTILPSAQVTAFVKCIYYYVYLYVCIYLLAYCTKLERARLKHFYFQICMFIVLKFHSETRWHGSTTKTMNWCSFLFVVPKYYKADSNVCIVWFDCWETYPHCMSLTVSLEFLVTLFQPINFSVLFMYS